VVVWSQPALPISSFYNFQAQDSKLQYSNNLVGFKIVIYLICWLHKIRIHDFHSEVYLQTLQCCTVCQYLQVRKWSTAYD